MIRDTARPEVLELVEEIRRKLWRTRGRMAWNATPEDWYWAVARTVRDRLINRRLETEAATEEAQARTVAYLSAEFLIGPQLGRNLHAVGEWDTYRAAVAELDLDLIDVLALEPEPGLGNGGLGRLAACYMESMATLEIPAIGYGIRYEYGIFTQEIEGGWQVERPDHWLAKGNPWEIRRPELTYPVRFGGHTEHQTDAAGRTRVIWHPDWELSGMAFDTPIVGHGVPSGNLLRLWRAEAAEGFDLAAFNAGDYWGAVESAVRSETISKVLYPNDEPAAGKRLRLQQQFFFVTCSLQDMMRRHLRTGASPAEFADRYAIQLNDTHPAIAVPELMRLLIDEYDLRWDEAWDVTQRTFAYTNHTLLPEALERWPVALIAQLLPRHLELIFEINQRFLDEVRVRTHGDEEKIRALSIIGEEGERHVRMANLAAAASHTINGVSQLHTELLKTSVMADHHALWPDKYVAITNGITPRRFMRFADPSLSILLDETIGRGWDVDLDRLAGLEDHIDDAGFLEAWDQAQRDAKRFLTKLAIDRGVRLDPKSMFDVLVKRIHEYKRQHLQLLHIVARYNAIKAGRLTDPVPRTFIFGGKAAPGYHMAKLIIKAINSVGDVVNADRDVNDVMRVVFVPNYNVTSAQVIYPAADLSEQISTAGYEASGTGNMKFALNGALTIGTDDGANVEIRERVGDENFFLFGLTTEEVGARRASGYDPRAVLAEDEELVAALDMLGSGYFTSGDADVLGPLVKNLRDVDHYLVLADFRAFCGAQAEVDAAWRDRARWTRSSVLNVARCGYFSSDRAIREYADRVWGV
ncbi:MAG: glycogen/starch/alpha-glucan phosphorylase [Acidimicrobiia bacterium]